jgi:rhodanese-related sulfurtransferase
MPTGIWLDELQRLLATGVQLVEVLPEREYAEMRLPDAINLPLKHLDAESAAALDRARPVVVYCWDSL